MNINWNKRYRESTSTTNDISELVGENLVAIHGLEKGSEEVVFFTASGKLIKLYHDQDCCEEVLVDEVDGNIADYNNCVVLSFEEVHSDPGSDSDDEDEDDYGDSHTWTFYKMETNKGGLTIKWHGESNGYYSEEVDVLGGEWDNDH